MATNTGNGFRRGAVKGESQMKGPNGYYYKRGPDGKFKSVKADGSPYKGVRKEH